MINMKLNWKSNNYVTVDKQKIPLAYDSENFYNEKEVIRKNSKLIFFLKRMIWPISNFLSYYLIDGFIEKGIGVWIKSSISKESIFLDIGCGNFRLQKYISKTLTYNAIDLSLSEFHLGRILKQKNSNICIASAKQIPIGSNSVSFIASTECFQHIPEFEKAAEEMYRILKPGSILVCSNSNPYSKKYQRKGPHIGVYNKWTNKQFIDLMESKNFRLIENYMKGYWLPLPKWLTQISIQFPITSNKENLNTCFFYKFVVVK